MCLRRFAILPFVLLTFSTVGLAQKTDVSFVAGGAFVSESRVPTGIATCTIPCPTDFTFKTDTHVFYAGTGAVRLVNFKLVSLHLEVPVAGIPSAPVVFSGSPAPTGLKLSSVFVTPSLRVKFAPGAPISPFASFGGGWARYSFAGPATNKGALQYGGGVDIKTGSPLLGFRAEVRDFMSGQPEFANISTQTLGSSSNGWRHNVLAGGGIVLRF
jgi:hypothetical protein